MFKLFKQMRKINRTRLADDERFDVDSNGRGIIDVGAENYDDIFSYYDLEGENVLDKEFDEFLEAKADAIPLKTELALHFHVKNASEEKREEIDRVFKSHHKRQFRALKRKLHKVTMFTTYMLFMFLIFFVIYIPFVVFNVHFIAQFIVEIIAWVFLWEVVDQWFMHRREIKHEMLKKYRFIRADIVVYEYKAKKKKQVKFGNNVKSLNKIIKQMDKDSKLTNTKIEKIEKITHMEE